MPSASTQGRTPASMGTALPDRDRATYRLDFEPNRVLHVRRNLGSGVPLDRLGRRNRPPSAPRTRGLVPPRGGLELRCGSSGASRRVRAPRSSRRRRVRSSPRSRPPTAAPTRCRSVPGTRAAQATRLACSRPEADGFEHIHCLGRFVVLDETHYRQARWEAEGRVGMKTGWTESELAPPTTPPYDRFRWGV